MDALDVDYQLEDDQRHLRIQPDVGEHHIALRFSSQVKSPLHGFTFGRNQKGCDIVFKNDPYRRLSNVHFRIYLNQWGVLMLEDMSTNGTIVDEVLLKKKEKRTLSSGSRIKILMFKESRDLEFMVRIPLRDGPCQEEYDCNLRAHLANRARLFEEENNKTIVPEPGGHVGRFSPALPTEHSP